MWQQIIPGLRIKLFMTLLVGIVYPLAITGICQVVFPHQANGSLVRAGERVIGSELIGQNFARPGYFHPRPSGAGTDGYDATASSGSNYGPTNRKLIERVKSAAEKFRQDNPGFSGPIPADLLMTSASGLDPHISPAAAQAQAARIASVRHVTQDRVSELIAQFIEVPDLAILGEPRVNVLRLNMALDQRFPSTR
jgi:K+-transporting ATPase ATPase C chain